MARHMAMASGGDAGEPPPTRPAAETPTQPAGPVLPPLTPNIDPERYAGLCKVVIRVDPRYAEPAVIGAARLWCRTSAGPESTDWKATALIARYLGLEAERVGSFNARAALRRVNVERYLQDRDLRQTKRSMRTMKTVLYTAGRILLPHEYPKSQAVDAPRVKRIAAASRAQIRDWYALAPTLTPQLARRLLILLDLCHGAGARAPDFKVLRGSSITAMHARGQPIAAQPGGGLSQRARRRPGGEPTPPRAGP
jgi:hypothetical protein